MDIAGRAPEANFQRMFLNQHSMCDFTFSWVSAGVNVEFEAYKRSLGNARSPDMPFWVYSPYTSFDKAFSS
jgi:hypothetical protein